MTARLCGAYADHVDHIVAKARWPRGTSALRPAGSTTAWRRLRAYVLDRDGHRCRIPVDENGAHIVDEQLPDELPPHPDHPDNLRAACALGNLQRGDGRRATTGANRRPDRWEW